ncbi:hypothetical protein ACH79_23110 [Bradyrhizobium sp. CCBAU 051011]|jgi:uncharacterized protein (DUF2147 family)|uniref:DUF2147 domain-containing protein n=1 Tax=Bradyrhizobium sp. CCBAU 051011 TaxID=858422 RepID=UPI0013742665|nr:DUF2147 domain-containing protein [Bradyrhizobium sp. CCBAU 051011]QHO75113.1 hypothetical protein ACH79_23110 [Bradyrhizobium sp. CCBAU 051011]
MLHCPGSVARTIVYSGIFLATGVNAALAADPTGDWKVADGVANIRVAQCSGNMWGVVAWEKQPGGKDKNNPDVAKQSRPTLGMPILIEMKKKPGVDAWEGQVYNAKDGQLYSSTIKPVGTDQLEIQGCVLGFLCGGETWTRVGPPIPSSPANSMAKGAPKGAPGAAPKSTAPATAAQAPAPAAPKTTGTANPAPANPAPKAAPGQKQAAAQPADIGDICLLPDIARFAH